MPNYPVNPACPVAPADLSAFGGWYWGPIKETNGRYFFRMGVNWYKIIGF